MRSWWVLFNTKIVKNESLQKLGCVSLTYGLDDISSRSKNFDFDALRQVVQFFLYVPIKFVALYGLRRHNPSPFWTNLIEFQSHVVGKALRLRLRNIYGE